MDFMHVQGQAMQMREWRRVPIGFKFASHKNPFGADVCGFVTKGLARWEIDGKEYTLGQGDSYYLRRDASYALLEVLALFDCIEVVARPEGFKETDERLGELRGGGGGKEGGDRRRNKCRL